MHQYHISPTTIEAENLLSVLAPLIGNCFPSQPLATNGLFAVPIVLHFLEHPINEMSTEPFRASSLSMHYVFEMRLYSCVA